jgi:hypothetical protein
MGLLRPSKYYTTNDLPYNCAGKGSFLRKYALREYSLTLKCLVIYITANHPFGTRHCNTNSHLETLNSQCIGFFEPFGDEWVPIIEVDTNQVDSSSNSFYGLDVLIEHALEVGCNEGQLHEFRPRRRRCAVRLITIACTFYCI